MSEGPRSDTDPSLVNEGRVRTSLYCHECSKNFIAEIDYDQDGCHEVHCAYCDHLHYRVVKTGRVWATSPVDRGEREGLGDTGLVNVVQRTSSTTGLCPSRSGSVKTKCYS